VGGQMKASETSFRLKMFLTARNNITGSSGNTSWALVTADRQALVKIFSPRKNKEKSNYLQLC